MGHPNLLTLLPAVLLLGGAAPGLSSQAQEPARAELAEVKSPAAALRVIFGQLDALQRPDGSWAGERRTTALVLLALAGDGQTLGQGPYRDQMRRGFAWLVGQMGEGGDLGGGDAKTHAIATGALADCQLLGPNPKIKAALQRAMGHLAELDVDASPGLLAWAGLAAASARDARVGVPAKLSGALDAGLAQRPARSGALAGACLAYARWTNQQPPAAWRAALEGQGDAEAAGKLTDEQLAFCFQAHFQSAGKAWDARFASLLPVAWLRTQNAVGKGAEALAGDNESLALMALSFESPYRLARVDDAR